MRYTAHFTPEAWVRDLTELARVNLTGKTTEQKDEHANIRADQREREARARRSVALLARRHVHLQDALKAA